MPFKLLLLRNDPLFVRIPMLFEWAITSMPILSNFYLGFLEQDLDKLSAGQGGGELFSNDRAYVYIEGNEMYLVSAFDDERSETFPVESFRALVQRLRFALDESEGRVRPARGETPDSAD
jgi:hypothetical protein